MTAPSLGTTMAKQLAGATEQTWREHKAGCPRCSRRRTRCRIGQCYWDVWQEAKGELAHCQYLDAQPNPLQEGLF